MVSVGGLPAYTLGVGVRAKILSHVCGIYYRLTPIPIGRFRQMFLGRITTHWFVFPLWRGRPEKKTRSPAVGFEPTHTAGVAAQRTDRSKM